MKRIMSDRPISRRDLLTTTSLAGFGGFAALLALSRPAGALTVHEMQGQTRELYLSACGSKDGGYHRQLVAEIRQRLEGRVTEAEIEAAIAATTCPVCGCPLIGA
jgi:hypothetical protein